MKRAYENREMTTAPAADPTQDFFFPQGIKKGDRPVTVKALTRAEAEAVLKARNKKGHD